MRIVFLGAPGSGKGTYGDMLSKAYGIPKISTGDLCREEVKKGTEIGRFIEKKMNEGGLVPDDIVLKLLKNRLERPDCEKGFILDGFPRTERQMEVLNKIIKVALVIYFNVSRKELLRRLSGRWTCRKCGAIYHETDCKPKRAGICDKCNGELYQRDDQKREIIEKRLEVYEKEIKPLLKRYEDMKIVKHINLKSMASIEDNFKKVLAIVEKRFGKPQKAK